MQLPDTVVSVLTDAVQTLERKIARPNEARVRLFASFGNTKAARIVALWDEEDSAVVPIFDFVDGTPIDSLEDVAAAMSVSTKTAARYVIQSKDAPEEVRRQAERELDVVVPEQPIRHWRVEDSDWGDTASLLFIPDDQQQFTVEGGTKEEHIHCTLAYFGECKDIDLNADGFLRFAQYLYLKAFTATINGQTVFHQEDGTRLVVLNVDSHDLELARRKVRDYTDGLDEIDINTEHGYSPHITIKQLPDNEDLPSAPLVRLPVRARFSTLRVSFGADQWDITLPDPQETKGIRRVRTPGGVAQYGQPIGTVIVRDALPSIPHKVTRTKRETLSNVLPVRNGVRVSYESVGRSDVPGMYDYNVWLEDVTGNESLETIRLLVTAKKASIKDISDSLIDDYHYIRPEKWNTLPESQLKSVFPIDQLKPASLDDAYQAAEEHLVVPTSTAKLMPSIETMGVVNAVMTAHTRKYGDMHQLIGQVNVEPNPVDHPSTIAWATGFQYRSMFRDVTQPVAYIGLSENWWPLRRADKDTTDRKSKVAADSLVNTEIEQEGKWASVDARFLAEQLGTDPITAHRVATLTHEIGHVVANLLDGDLDDLLSDEAREKIVKNRQVVRQLVDDMMADTQRPLDDIRRWRPHVHVSEYGMVSSEEHEAEIWAAYNLRLELTPYVSTVGYYMADSLRVAIADLKGKS